MNELGFDWGMKGIAGGMGLFQKPQVGVINKFREGVNCKKKPHQGYGGPNDPPQFTERLCVKATRDAHATKQFTVGQSPKKQEL